MVEYLVVATVYRDLKDSIRDVGAHALELNVCTSIKSIKCNSIKEIPEIFLNNYGEEIDALCRKEAYLYLKTEKGWERITD